MRTLRPLGVAAKNSSSWDKEEGRALRILRPPPAELQQRIAAVFSPFLYATLHTSPVSMSCTVYDSLGLNKEPLKHHRSVQRSDIHAAHGEL